MTIWVTGGRGRLGSELVRLGCEPLNVDISDEQKVRTAVSPLSSKSTIINCAAFTDVDAAESNFKKAFNTNTLGVEYLRRHFQGRMIHISTDYVFSGKKGPYNEKSRVDEPVNAYGRTKWGGELVFLNPVTQHEGDVLVRTTGLYGGEKPDFAKAVVETLLNRMPMYAVDYVYGNQTHVSHLAYALLALVDMTNPPPIIHLASQGTVSRYEFARMIADAFGWDKSQIYPTKSVVGWVAKRPTLRAGLDVSLARKLGLPIYYIREGLELFRNSITEEV